MASRWGWECFSENASVKGRLAASTVMGFAVSVAIIGDARMRLPTAPLYSVLLACVLAGRQRNKGMGSPPADVAG